MSTKKGRIDDLTFLCVVVISCATVLSLTIMGHAQTDWVSTFNELERANLQAIHSIQGRAFVTRSAMTPNKKTFVQNILGLFQEAGTEDRVRGETVREIQFWYDLLEEKYRWNTDILSSTYSLVSVDGTIKAQVPVELNEIQKSNNLRALILDNTLTRFYYLDLYTVLDSTGSLEFARKAIQEQVETSIRRVLQRGDGITLWELFTGRNIPKRYSNIGGQIINLRKIVLADGDAKCRFQEESIGDNQFLFSLIYTPDDGRSPYASTEWLVDLSIPGCLETTFRGKDSSAPVLERKWEWQKKNGIAFPAKVSFKDFTIPNDGNDKQLRGSTDIEIKELVINEPIEDHRFSISDLGLDENDYIRDRTLGIDIRVTGL